MIPAKPEQLHVTAQVAKMFPDFVQFLAEWRQRELEALPMAVNNPAVAQGRCQVLNELVKFVSQAPDYAANPRPGKPATTHTDRSV